MTENFSDLSKQQLLELAEIERVRCNELQKYAAAAIDRISTAIAVSGLLGPVIIIASNGVGKSFWVAHSLIIAYSLLLACGLHLVGRRILVRGLR